MKFNKYSLRRLQALGFVKNDKSDYVLKLDRVKNFDSDGNEILVPENTPSKVELKCNSDFNNWRSVVTLQDGRVYERDMTQEEVDTEIKNIEVQVGLYRFESRSWIRFFWYGIIAAVFTVIAQEMFISRGFVFSSIVMSVFTMYWVQLDLNTGMDLMDYYLGVTNNKNKET